MAKRSTCCRRRSTLLPWKWMTNHVSKFSPCVAFVMRCVGVYIYSLASFAYARLGTVFCSRLQWRSCIAAVYVYYTCVCMTGTAAVPAISRDEVFFVRRVNVYFVICFARRDVERRRCLPRVYTTESRAAHSRKIASEEFLIDDFIRCSCKLVILVLEHSLVNMIGIFSDFIIVVCSTIDRSSFSSLFYTLALCGARQS